MNSEVFRHKIDHYFIGISRYELKIFQVRQHQPEVVCKAGADFKQVYQLNMYSTDCNGKKNASDTSAYSYCYVHHAIKYEVLGVVDNSAVATRIAIAIYILLFILVWLAVIGCVCYRKWGSTLKWLTWKSKKLKTQQAYNDFDPSKEVETTQQQQA